ncbi:MAG TPA: DNA internalization-related competence protein ComEC/Rec2 [Candidatus Eremiobacteraceae bacterium]
MEALFSAAYRAHAFAIAFGAYAVGVIAISAEIHTWIATFAALASVVAVLLSMRELRPLAITIFTAFVVGSMCAALALRGRADVPFAPLDEHHVVARVVVIDRPRPTTTGLTMRVRIVAVDAPRSAAAAALRGEVALFDFPSVARPDRLAGQLVLVRARLSIPGGARNDGEPAERDELDEQGVSLILAAPSAYDVKPLGDAPGWEAWMDRLRLACAHAVEARLPPLEATVLEGILWGDRGQLPAALRQEFSDTGTVHVLTTAGLHLGIFAALVTWLLVRLPIPRPLRTGIVLCASWGYAALAGLHVPTIRAATMLTAGAVAYESGRGRSASAVLAAAAFAVALPHPLALLSPSFSMSFACVGGIALLSPALRDAGLNDDCGLPPRVVELGRTSLAVQVAMWPFQALYFDAFTPWAVFANLVVVPLVGIIMALGGALLAATAVCPPLLAPLSNLAWWMLSLMIAVVDKFASLPHAHVDVPPPTHAFLILYWFALTGAAWTLRDAARRHHLVRWAAPAAAALLLTYVAPGIQAALDPRLHVDAIDVGQADCILVRAPGMHAMLVDGGGRLERSGSNKVVAQPIGDVIATRTVMPFLLRHWVLHLDAVVLTHPHGDHAGGLPVILSRENVGVLYDSAQLYGGPAYQRALDVVRQRHVRYRVARRGESFDLGSSTYVKVLEPELPLITGSSSDINNNSVVLRVEFGNTAVLLTGDAQSEAEARMLSHGGADLRADILKVGHHGSAYSSTPAFLAAVHPKIAIISCGLHNVFGHPSPKTLDALNAVGARIYRTDLDGGVEAETDGVRVRIRTFGQ